jgi:DnaJ like chaperone protein
MNFVGKIIGGLAGLATGRIGFVILGIVLGHQFDRGFSTRYANFKTQGESQLTLPEGFARALFQVMGRLAKADGVVTEDEIRAARALMHRLNMGPAQIRMAIGWFNEGKDPAYPLSSNIRELRARHARRPELRSLFVRLLMEVSLAKSRLQQVERTILWSICKELDISRVEFAQLEAMLRAQRGFRHSPQGDADSAKVARAYQTLGVDKSATNAEVKKAYRRLMSRHHPDKIAGDNPGDAVIGEAEKMTREVRSAYELLKMRRAIR